MALSLQSLSKGKQPKAPRIVLYGVQGIGKSCFGASLPNPVFLQTEDGLGGIDTTSFPLAKSFDELLEAIGVLYKEKHKHKTVVLDSLDWTERLIWDKVCQENGVASIEKIGYAKGYIYAISEWKRLLEGFNALRDEKGMIVLLTAHSQIKRFDSPEVEPYDRYKMKLHREAEAFVQEWADAVLFCNYKIITRKVDVGFGTTISQGKALVDNLGSGQRVIYTEERPAFYAKNRYGMPVELPMPKKNPSGPVMESIAGTYAADEQTENQKEVSNG